MRRITIGCSGQSSPSSSSISYGSFEVVRAVAEPVVDLELDPRGGKDVQRRRRDELVPRHQLAADRARVRRRESRLLLREGVLERDVAARNGCRSLPMSGFSRSLNVPSGSPRREVARARRSPFALGHGQVRRLARVEEVPLAQPVPHQRDHGHAERQRQPVPADPPLEPVRQLDDAFGSFMHPPPIRSAATA